MLIRLKPSEMTSMRGKTLVWTQKTSISDLIQKLEHIYRYLALFMQIYAN